MIIPDHFHLAHQGMYPCQLPETLTGFKAEGWATTRTDSRDTLRASASRSLAVAVSRSALACPRASSAPTSASQHCRRSEWTKGRGVEPAYAARDSRATWCARRPPLVEGAGDLEANHGDGDGFDT
jgi:hypothetical protein